MVDLKELRKDDVVLIPLEGVLSECRWSIKLVPAVVNKITCNGIIAHVKKEKYDFYVFVKKEDIFSSNIGDNDILRNMKGIENIGDGAWRYDGDFYFDCHRFQNALWDDGIECWPKGTCDEEKEVEL